MTTTCGARRSPLWPLTEHRCLTQDTLIRIISNAVALLGNLAGLVGVRAYRAGNVDALAFRVYLGFLPLYSIYTIVYTLQAIAVRAACKRI